MGLFDRWRGKRISLVDGDFFSQFFGGGSHAGETVNMDTVMQIGAAYACSRKIAESISSLPFQMVEVGAAGAITPLPDHRLSRLLGDQPNADQSAQQFWELVVLQLVLRGNHYSLRLELSGQTIGLEPLPPHPETYCRRTPSGAREFVVQSGPRQGTYTEAEVFFIPGFGEDRDCGMSVITKARQTFGRLLALERHQSNLYRKGVRPSMVLKTGKVLNDAQRKQVKESIIEGFVGAGNAGGAMVLEADFDVQPLTLTPADAQLLESMQFGVEEVCRWFGTPPWIAGYSNSGSNWGTGLEQQFRAYGMLTLQPHTKRIIGEIRRQLMSPAERRRLEPRMPLDALYAGDSTTMAANDERLVRSGIETQNEVRARRGLPPKEGGDELRMQQQMVPTSTGEPDAPPAE